MSINVESLSEPQNPHLRQDLRLNYGLIGNGQTAALISQEGSIDWCCMPSFESPSLFAQVLDATSGGFFRIQPIQKQNLTTTQQYIKNTNALETQFCGDGFEFKIHDFMPRWEKEGGHQVYCPCEIHRMVELTHGEPEIVVSFQPSLNYGYGETRLEKVDDHCLVATQNDYRIYLTSNVLAQDILDQRAFTLHQGTYFIVSYQEPCAANSFTRVLEYFNRTVNYWRRWVKHCYLPDEYQEILIRSALTLKQLIYEPTGAIIAAPTTSLPEIVGGERNWDYRYCWLRDSFFIINALLKLSQFEETEGFLNYLKGLMQNQIDYLRPLYTIEGQPVPEEKFIEHWAGYGNSQPVRIGNNATSHYQNDVYGEMMLALYPIFTDERFVRPDLDDLWEIVKRLVAIAQMKFEGTDNGIWEFRHLSRHYTFSKLMCWVALDRATRIAYRLKKETLWRRWSRARNLMRQEILEKAWNPTVQAFTQSYGSEHLDASTLLMPILDFIPAKDPRMFSTIIQSEERLMVNGFAFRYTNEDDFGRPENAFTVCTFWLIDALIRIGRKKQARAYFENVLKTGNHLGLFSEDINPETGAMTGNFPQGYTHVAIINTAMLLAQ